MNSVPPLAVDLDLEQVCSTAHRASVSSAVKRNLRTYVMIAVLIALDNTIKNANRLNDANTGKVTIIVYT